MNMTYASEADRVRANTAPEVLKEIDSSIREQVTHYATQPLEVISRRIQELDQEWDVERWLETNASALALGSLILGVMTNRKWLLLTGGVLGFLFQHAVQGWCPPLPVLRRLGIRTREEIDREKFALKFLRGDFDSIPPERSEFDGPAADRLLRAVTA
jgi:hypothetical protein